MKKRFCGKKSLEAIAQNAYMYIIKPEWCERSRKGQVESNIRWLKREVSKKYGEESAQQCKEENDKIKLMQKEENFGSDISYLRVSSRGGISHGVQGEEIVDLWDASEVKALQLC